MKKLSLIIFLIISNFTFACQCYNQNIQDEIKKADLVFIGYVIKKTMSDKVYNEFVIKKFFKNENPNLKNQNLVISTGFGGGDCGIDFEERKEYLVFSKNGETSRCRKNELVENSRYLAYVKYTFDKDYRSKLGMDNSKSLTSFESNYFNDIYERKDFNKSNIEFLDGEKTMSKSKYFENWGAKYVNTFIIKLDSNEKMRYNNLDFLVILNSKKNKITKSYRKKC